MSQQVFYTFFLFNLRFKSQSLDIWNFGANVSMRLAYPSSMRVKDWDKLEDEVKKHEKNEKPEGDTALNKFFRKIYSNADEDMRREMSKSFTGKRLELRKSRALLLMSLAKAKSLKKPYKLK
ncbi:protein SGT1 homolog A isoform X3 [Brassica rapa]|uniref:protein SGT1 homolog A isoform X3 n=1 Tax=Brassica campestris TaxID=3711 RepID=UPI00142DF396|nr:protein SGT1 homolog A isoform X3 [Brassica rapa]